MQCKILIYENRFVRLKNLLGSNLNQFESKYRNITNNICKIYILMWYQC